MCLRVRFNMGQKINKFLSTIMVASTLMGLSSCVNKVNKPVQNDEITETKYSDVYSSEEQIRTIVEAIGADNSMITSYNPERNNKSIRLAHNNGKPIEVAFHPNFEGLESYAKETLDYLFGIVNSINPMYKYEVVDFKSIYDHDIVMQASSEQKPYHGTTSISSMISDDGVANIDWGIVTIYKENIKSVCKSREEFDKVIRYVMTHELMHVFGFDDIYTIIEDIDIDNLVLQPEEVQAVKWADEDEIINMIDKGIFIPYHKDLIKLLFFMRNNRGTFTNN